MATVGSMLTYLGTHMPRNMQHILIFVSVVSGTGQGSTQEMSGKKMHSEYTYECELIHLRLQDEGIGSSEIYHTESKDEI